MSETGEAVKVLSNLYGIKRDSGLSLNGNQPGAPDRNDAVMDFKLTDSGNSEAFAHLYGAELRYDHRRGRWLRWAGHWWTPDADGLAERRSKDLARWRIAQASEIEDDATRSAWVKWGITSESRQRREATLSLARSEAPIADAGDGWDADPWTFGVGNGVIDLRIGTLRPGAPGDKITRHSEVPFHPDAQAPRWRQFLEEVFKGDPELVDFVFRAVGYSMTGDTTGQVFFLCFGEGSNGKNRLMGTLARMFGGYWHNLPFSSLEQERQYQIPTDLADLDGARFVTASESSKAGRLNEARIKAITGQDPLSARHMRQDFFTFQPRAKLWLATNHKPRVADESYGFWRRVRLIPFAERFVDDHVARPGCVPDHRHADGSLAEALWAEREGILAWAVQGCLAWQKRGLGAPKVVMTGTAEYQAEEDPLGEFIAEVCVLAAECQVQAAQLFKAYTAWAAGLGMRPQEILTARSFSERVRRRFPAEHTRTGTVYRGIGLRAGLAP